MIRTGTRGTRKQASEGASKAGVPTPGAESRELKPEDCFPFFRSLSPAVPKSQSPAARSRRNPTVGFFPSAANPASSADSAAFPLPCSLVPCFSGLEVPQSRSPRFYPPPSSADPTPPYIQTHPPHLFCETVEPLESTTSVHSFTVLLLSFCFRRSFFVSLAANRAKKCERIANSKKPIFRSIILAECFVSLVANRAEGCNLIPDL